MKRSAIITVAIPFSLVFLSLWAFASGSAAQCPDKPQYLCPLPGAQLVSPATTIIVRPGTTLSAASVSSELFRVAGTRSGIHSGSVVIADDKETVIFEPALPFAPGEEVQVVIGPGITTESGCAVGAVSFRFTVSDTEPATQADLLRQLAYDELEASSGAPSHVPAPAAQSSSALPSNFPVITVTTQASDTADGYLFLTPFTPLPGFTAATSFLLIMDNSGQPLYLDEVDGLAFDLKKQPNGLLTYWQLGGTFKVMDSSYHIVDTIEAGNGYSADSHELLLLPNGHAILMAYDPQIMDLSAIAPGGYPTATVLGLIVQELDSSRDVVFQWRSWDHMLITDTLVSLTTPSVDYVHGNAIELDDDGNLMISSRHLSEITKIDRETGEIIWRLGGKNNQFAFVGDAPPYFDFQHDIRRLANGNITLFDNRTNLMPKYSRAVEYQLDEQAKTATLVWEYRNTPDTFSMAMGNAQRLSNGNTVVGWGSAPYVTEVKPDTSKAFEIRFGGMTMNYRAYRFTWHGQPSAPALLSVQRPDLATALLTISWNGATDITSYRVYAGDRTRPTALVATQARSGFETQIVLTDSAAQSHYFRVMPVDTQGWETVYSNEVQSWSVYLPAITASEGE